MSYSSESIGKTIKIERSNRKWSQARLGKELGISGKQISNYENGILTPPTDILFNMCNIFGCQLGYLLGEEDYKDKTKLDTAIANKLNLSSEAISSLCRITGSDNNCILFGHKSANIQRLINALFTSECFINLIEAIHELDSAVQHNNDLWINLEKKYGKTRMDRALKYYHSQTDYLRDENAPKLPSIYYEILSAIDNELSHQTDASFSIKVLRYEIRETFERLLDSLYPQ